eukprot:1857391-Prymnesium_polylepis.1
MGCSVLPPGYARGRCAPTGCRGGHGPLKLPRFHVPSKPPCFAEHKLHPQADGGCARDRALCQHGGRC